MCFWDDLGRNAPEMHFPAGIFRNALFLWFLHFWLKFCIQERTFFEECSRNALLECNFGMLQKCTFPRVFQFFCCSGKDFWKTFPEMFQNALFPQECSRNALLECSRNALFLGLRKIWFQECTFPTGMLQECTFGMLQKCTFSRAQKNMVPGMHFSHRNAPGMHFWNAPEMHFF